MSNLTISMRFAIDRDQNRQISKEEIVPFQDLSALDDGQDKVLDGAELDPVYFEYSKDTWLQAGRTHEVDRQNFTLYVTLQSIGLEPPAVDLKIDISL